MPNKTDNDLINEFQDKINKLSIDFNQKCDEIQAIANKKLANISKDNDNEKQLILEEQQNTLDNTYAEFSQNMDKEKKLLFKQLEELDKKDDDEPELQLLEEELKSLPT